MSMNVSQKVVQILRTCVPTQLEVTDAHACATAAFSITPVDVRAKVLDG